MLELVQIRLVFSPLFAYLSYRFVITTGEFCHFIMDLNIIIIITRNQNIFYLHNKYPIVFIVINDISVSTRYEMCIGWFFLVQAFSRSVHVRHIIK